MLLYTSNDNKIIHGCSLLLCKLLSIHQANVFIKCKIHTILIHLISKWNKRLSTLFYSSSFQNIIDGLQILSIWTVNNYHILIQLKQHNFISKLHNWVTQWFVQLPVSNTCWLNIEIWELVGIILKNIVGVGCINNKQSYNNRSSKNILLKYEYDDYTIIMDMVYNILRLIFREIPKSFEMVTQKVKIDCCKVIINLVDIHQFGGIIDFLTQDNELYVAKELIQAILLSEYPSLRSAVIKMFNGIIYQCDEDDDVVQLLIEDCQILNKIKSILINENIDPEIQHWIFILLSNIICHDYGAQIITNDSELIQIITNGLTSSNFTNIRDGSIYCINNLLNAENEMTQFIVFKHLIPSFCTSLKKLNQYRMNEGNKKEYIALIKSMTNKLRKYNKSGQDEQLSILKLVANQLKKYEFVSICDDLILNDDNIYIKDVLWILLGNMQYLTDIASHETIKKMNEWNNKISKLIDEEDNLWKILGKTPPQKM